MSEKIILNLTSEQISVLFGNFDENINKIQNEYNVSIVNRSEGLKIIGEPKNIEDAEKAECASHCQAQQRQQSLPAPFFEFSFFHFYYFLVR